MSIISPAFLLFISVVFVCYYAVPMKYRWGVLLLSSYVFYIASDTWLTVFLVVSTVSVYLGAKCITKRDLIQKQKKKELEKPEFKAFKEINRKKKLHIILLIICVNFGILFTIKYANFFTGNINAVVGLFGTKDLIPQVNWIKPLGISYYTLMAVSYVADVYYGKYAADDNIGKVALYLVFFPCITEGPISRFDQLADKLYEGHPFDFENFKKGITLIIIGFAKKLVIADRAAIFVNNVFADYKHCGGFTLFMAGVLYTLQIYAEFSGAMNIALGVAKTVGVDVTPNFRRPFFSQDVNEFWRRWHITLGAWLRDYVFYPISLSKSCAAVTKWSRGKIKNTHLSKLVCAAYPLLFVWFGNGIWHGASWKYILYGMYYYLIMMIGMLIAPLMAKLLEKLHINGASNGCKYFRIARTTLLVIIGMTLFRSHDITSFNDFIGRTFTAQNTGIMNFGLKFSDYIILGFSTVCMFIGSLYEEKGNDIYKDVNSLKIVWKYAFYLLLINVVIVLGVYGIGYNSADFIYGAY